MTHLVVFGLLVSLLNIPLIQLHIPNKSTSTPWRLLGYITENCSEWQNRERREFSSTKKRGLRSYDFKMTNNNGIKFDRNL